jgi:hypothetical protein
VCFIVVIFSSYKWATCYTNFKHRL